MAKPYPPLHPYISLNPGDNQITIDGYSCIATYSQWKKLSYLQLTLMEMAEGIGIMEFCVTSWAVPAFV